MQATQLYTAVQKAGFFFPGESDTVWILHDRQKPYLLTCIYGNREKRTT